MKFINLKSKVKIFLVQQGSLLLKLFPRFYFPIEAIEKKTRHYVVFHLSAFGSLGDSAMAYSIITQIKENDEEAKITVFIHKNADAVHFQNYGVNIISIEGFFSVIPKRTVTKRMAKVIETATDYIIPGADVLDGVYTPGGAFRRLFSGIVAQNAGADVHVIGFSFSHRANNKIKTLFKEKLQGFNIVCRDPHSAQRLSDVMDREIPYGADLAFLLPIGEFSKHDAAIRAESRVSEWKRNNVPVVIFNANPLSFTNALPDISRDEVVKVMAESLDEFVKLTSSAILFLTHDNRTAHSDAAFVDEIIKHLKTEIKYEFVPETVEPTDIKRLCSFSELIVTGRMHLGIAGLGTGTVTMITDYQGKVTGLYELFETPNLRLDLAEIIKPKKLSNLMVDAFNEREKYKKTIAKNLPKVITLSRKNLQSVW